MRCLAIILVGIGLAGVAACDRRPKEVVAHGAACTSPYDDTTRPARVCGADQACLLFWGPAYVCAKPCTTDAECASVEPGLTCLHENGHGDRRGCAKPAEAPRPSH